MINNNITLFVVIICAMSVVALTASSGCKLKKNAVKKKIKQYKSKCLKKGFQSSIDCKTERGKLSKKATKKCRKLEGILKKCDYSCLPPIDGGWTDYRKWTTIVCSAPCGEGKKIRRRSCSKPSPTFGGVDCVGKAEESQSCNIKKCPGWSNFGDWSACSVTCGGGDQVRRRLCNNPAPAFGEPDCVGNAEESKRCNKKSCPVNGGWSNYGSWSVCSVTCGGGYRVNLRYCNNPAPAHGGRSCSGSSVIHQRCNTHYCRYG